MFGIALVVVCQPSELLCLLSSLDSGLRLYFIRNRNKPLVCLVARAFFLFFFSCSVCVFVLFFLYLLIY